MPMFIIRNDGARPADHEIKLRRRTPALQSAPGAEVDWFCLGDPAAAQEAGHQVVTLHDGWYADDHGGGVAIYGPFWEIRDTPFTVRETAPDPAPAADPRQAPEVLNVRKAIFGA